MIEHLRPKLAIVGLGKIARDQHIPSIYETGWFDLAAIVSRSGMSVAGLPTFTSQAELFQAMPDIAAVANCTPPLARHDAVIEALTAGKHVLAEKPPTVSVSELADIKRAASRYGVTFFATWHAQFNAAVLEAIGVLAERPPAAVRIEWREDVRRWHPGQDWVFEPGGFGVFDPGINALSILVRIMPFPIFVESAMLEFPENRGTPIAASLMFKASGKFLGGTAAFDWRQEGEQTWTIEIDLQDGGRLRLAEGGLSLEVDGVLSSVDKGEGEYRRIYRRFASLIASHRSQIDVRPLYLVADAMLCGERRIVAPFGW